MLVNKVLIIDDDEGFQHYLMTLFHEEYPSINVIQAYDGHEAGQILNNLQDKPNVIFLDLYMPRLDGQSFLQMRKAQFLVNDIKVVVMTSSDLEKDREITQSFEFIEDYIIKDELKTALKRHLVLQ